MVDISLQQLQQLLDKQFSPLRRDVARVGREMKGISTRLDIVATKVARVDDHVETLESGLKTVLETQGQHSRQFAQLDRKLSQHTDRLDDHGQRREALEGKTAHLPTTTS